MSVGASFKGVPSALADKSLSAVLGASVLAYLIRAPLLINGARFLWLMTSIASSISFKRNSEAA